MNDWHLDPPDYPEPPECCGDIMVDFEDGVCLCSICGDRVAPYEETDIEPMPEWQCEKCGKKYPCDCEEEIEGPAQCQHGNMWGDCATCDHLADLAYDAARESRFSR